MDFVIGKEKMFGRRRGQNVPQLKKQKKGNTITENPQEIKMPNFDYIFSSR